MKKVLILTRTTTRNFGTVLQAYALQKSIQSLGYQAYILEDKLVRERLSSAKSIEYSAISKSIKEIVYDFYDRIKMELFYARERKIQGQVDKFKKKHITFYLTDNLNELNQNFDVFVSGSDQIWAQAAEPYLYAFFMQDFVRNDKLKISYAVSIGETGFKNNASEMVEKLVNRFDFLSVREKSSYEVLKQYVDSEKISIVCDPVIHLDEEQWGKLTGKRYRRQKYVFCYCLSAQEWYFEKIKFLEQKFSCEILVYCNEKITFSTGKVLSVCSPKGFLNYIKYAEFILTDSYHALLFSLIFKKNFCVLQRFDSKGTNIQNGRINYILDLLSVKDKVIDSATNVNTDLIDFESVKKVLEDYKFFSIKYLENALNNEELCDG